MTSGKRNLIIALIVILVVAGSLYSFFKGTYNQFVTLDETVKSSWAQVESQYQRRADLILIVCYVHVNIDITLGYLLHAEYDLFLKVARKLIHGMGKLAYFILPVKMQPVGEVTF